MKKVITYGTYDLLHFGHIRLLERAKSLGDYLIVAVTSDNFDKQRGKINVKQSLIERIENVKKTGLADEIIVEEYEGQKIDDIKKYNIDIFTVGSDWVGKFDYLSDYCEVVYLERTEGVSSTELRSNASIKLGFVGEASFLHKFVDECQYINGLNVCGIYSKQQSSLSENLKKLLTNKPYDEFLDDVDAIFVATQAPNKFELLETALNKKKHILCESPIANSAEECKKLFDLAEKNGCILMESNKTAYAIAYYKLLLLAKSKKIGQIVSIDATCTSLMDKNNTEIDKEWKSFYSWGPTVLLPVFQLLGTDFKHKQLIASYLDSEKTFDGFCAVNLVYPNAVANLKVGKGIKSEGHLVISGTEGYIYVPAPWWKTEYFELRYENEMNNRKYFFKLEGEGIRCELSVFARSVMQNRNLSRISKTVSLAISEMMKDFNEKNNITELDI